MPRPWRAWVIGALAVAAWVALVYLAAAESHRFRPKPRNGVPEILPWTPWVPTVVLAAWGLVAGITLGIWMTRPAGRVLPRMIAGLGAAAALAGALAAAQLLPVLEFTGQTARAAEAGPHDIYPFSVEPLRVAELAWPGFFGATLRENRSWLEALTAARHALWVPSLYLGGLTLVLALTAAGFRQGPPWRAWLSAIALVSLLGALGEYGGPLYWLRFHPELARPDVLGPHDPIDVPPVRFDGHLRDGDGSVYWLLATILPGFERFRYPAKLLTFSSLALAALAGLGWDRLRAGFRGRFVAFTATLLGLSLLGLGVATAYRPQITASLEHLAASSGSIFGPLDVSGAFGAIRGSLVHGGVILALGWGLALLARRYPRAAGVAALVVTTIDLAWANARLVVSRPQAEFETEPRVLALIRQAEAQDPTPGPFRIHRMPLWNPHGWLTSPSPDRVGDFVRWERDTIQPKYALPYHMPYTITEGTAELFDYEWFFGGFYRTLNEQNAALLQAEPGQKIVYFPRRGFDLWNTRYFVLPLYPNRWSDERRGFASFLPDTELIYPPPDAFRGPGGEERQRLYIEWHDFQVRRNRRMFPRAWVIHQARYLKEPVRGLEKESRQEPMEEMLYSAQDPFWHDPDRHEYDPRALAWIEPEDRVTVQPWLSHTGPDPAETVTVGPYDNPQRVELEATLQRPGLVVLADVYYPGWRLTIDGHEAPILRVNRLMRGALVPSGRHRLVYTYDPPSFRLGLWGSALGLLAALGLAAWSARQPRPDPAVESWIAPG
ncbi:MAG: YfhO family protein [Isosphaeraceae bacterium]|nr:YfhO family protein [Isosphaeraceae bacterium]